MASVGDAERLFAASKGSGFDGEENIQAKDGATWLASLMVGALIESLRGDNGHRGNGNSRGGRVPQPVSDRGGQGLPARVGSESVQGARGPMARVRSLDATGAGSGASGGPVGQGPGAGAR